MAKKQKEFDKIIEFANKYKGFFFVIGNPITDELLITFNEQNSFVKFPITLDKSQNVMVRMLNKTTFAQGMSDFLSGLVKGIKADPEDDSTKQIAEVIGGSVQTMVGFNSDNKKTNGKE